MNVLVTGGAGFIGSNLVKELLDKNYQVHVIDIFMDPMSIFRLDNLKKRTTFSILDIRDKKKVSNFLKNKKFDYIFHLAAEPIVEKAYEDPISVFETNIMGTINIMEGSRALKNLKGVIFASSDKAYGKSDKAYKENFPLKGDHPYDVSKSSADLIVQAYFKTYGLPVAITRFGNVYGEGDFHFGRIIPDLCEAVIKNKTLKIRSDGTYVRDYLYVRDVVRGYLFLLENFERARGGAFNFSSEDTLSVLEVIKKAEKVLKVKIPYEILNTAQNEIPYQHLDDSRIRRLGWKPEFSMDESLPKALSWYKKIILE